MVAGHARRGARKKRDSSKEKKHKRFYCLRVVFFCFVGFSRDYFQVLLCLRTPWGLARGFKFP
jgi:hypothetical protein